MVLSTPERPILTPPSSPSKRRQSLTHYDPESSPSKRQQRGALFPHNQSVEMELEELTGDLSMQDISSPPKKRRQRQDDDVFT